MKSLLCLILIAMVVGCFKKPQTTKQAAEPPSPSKPPIKSTEQTKGNPERRNIVVLTPRAAMAVRKNMKDLNLNGTELYLRASIGKNNEYKLDIDQQMDPDDDYLGESQGVRIVVDRKSSLLLPVGIVVDYVREDGHTGFKFLPPEYDREPPDTSLSLVEARHGFKTTLARRESGKRPPPVPPAELFGIVRYDAFSGKLIAYLSPDPKDGKKHPAIIWITGGDCNSIDEGCWQEGTAANDQSACAYRKAGLIMMFPALRGGNDNPGDKEGFFGEVDDVLAAREFLATQSFVDPDRIYLGGHSTGGTLALLTAECSDRFRAVFSFGPVADVLSYGPNFNPFALSDRKECQLRAPRYWLHSIRGPVFVFEGSKGGNATSLQSMATSSKNPNVQFFEVKGSDHFSVLAPTNRLIAQKILRDTETACNLKFSEDEVNKLFAK